MSTYREPPRRENPEHWITDYCPRCKARTTFWFVGEILLRCEQCTYEKDRSVGLGLHQGPEGEKPAAP